MLFVDTLIRLAYELRSQNIDPGTVKVTIEVPNLAAYSRIFAELRKDIVPIVDGGYNGVKIDGTMAGIPFAVIVKGKYYVRHM